MQSERHPVRSKSRRGCSVTYALLRHLHVLLLGRLLVVAAARTARARATIAVIRDAGGNANEVALRLHLRRLVECRPAHRPGRKRRGDKDASSDSAAKSDS